MPPEGALVQQPLFDTGQYDVKSAPLKQCRKHRPSNPATVIQEPLISEDPLVQVPERVEPQIHQQPSTPVESYEDIQEHHEDMAEDYPGRAWRTRRR